MGFLFPFPWVLGNAGDYQNQSGGRTLRNQRWYAIKASDCAMQKRPLFLTFPVNRNQQTPGAEAAIPYRYQGIT